MKSDVPIKNGIVIPGHELEITTSRAGGPGGQHVNKTDTRVTIRWNIKTTGILNEKQKERIFQNIGARLTEDGDLIIHQGASRSQQQNKEAALERLAQIVRQALHIPKKRMVMRISKEAKKLRLEAKKQRGTIKKTRSKHYQHDE